LGSSFRFVIIQPPLSGYARSNRYLLLNTSGE
jgi:hypothetical protein